MPALNFKKQFADDVESGKKRQSIRAKRADGRNPHAGQPAYLFTGMRTKSCRRLRTSTFISVEEIILDWHSGIFLQGRWLLPAEVLYVAKDDGFPGWPEMKEFFRKEHDLSGDNQFHGLLMKWL